MKARRDFHSASFFYDRIKNGDYTMEKRKTLIPLFIPIFFEILFFMLAGMVDTLMLSSIGDHAVGAVGTANTYIGMFILMFSIVSTGMMAVMTQNIGAGKEGVAYQARNIGLIFNLAISVPLCFFLCIFSKKLLLTIGISEALENSASTYMKIVGGACFLNALIPVFSGYLRAFGHTKYPLFATITGNIINLVLNAIFLFVCHWGVAGVAWATVISRVVNLSIVIVLGMLNVKAKQSPERENYKVLLKQIIQIGFPSALETLLYNISMTLAIKFLNQMDSEGFNVAARAYSAQVANFSFCAGAALAQANAIITGWLVGQKKYDECMRGTRKALGFGILISSFCSIIIAVLSPKFVGLLSDNPEMIKIVSKLLWIDVILEFGRVTNLIYGNALKTCGDAICPVILGVVFMFLCSVLGTYVLGIQMGLLVTGCYIALTCDECFRGVGMILRWKSKKWQGKGLVK